MGGGRQGEFGIHLHDAHDGLVGLRGDNHLGHHHELERLRLGFYALRHMHVHLVAVEVGVVRARHRQVEAEGGVGHHAHAVAHDGHLVQRGLPVEEHHVPGLQMPLHLLQAPKANSGKEEGQNAYNGASLVR
eukprot:8667311-Pyramimonas_sp.AAC.3